MRLVYPVLIDQVDFNFEIYAPDFNSKAEAETLPDAIQTARDMIGLMVLLLDAAEQELPFPTDITGINKAYPEQIITLIDVDPDEYRKKYQIELISGENREINIGKRKKTAETTATAESDASAETK